MKLKLLPIFVDHFMLSLSKYFPYEMELSPSQLSFNAKQKLIEAPILCSVQL